MIVLHTNFLKGWGGQSNRVLTEAAGVAAKGHRVVVASPPKSQLAARTEATASALGIATLSADESIRFVGGFRWGVLNDVFAMKHLLLTLAPDILHLHGGRDSWTAAAALALLPRTAKRPRVIRTKHNVFPVSRHPANRWFYARRCDMLVGLSQAIVRQLSEIPGVDPARIRRIPSAVDLARFDTPPPDPARRAALRAELGIAPGDTVVAMTGRLRPEKGHATLIAAAPAILAARPDVRFLLLGSGSSRGSLESDLARDPATAARFTLTGFRDDVPDCLRVADLYVQPSHSEGLGTSVIEAGAARLPIAASDTGGIPDVVAHGETGLLFPVGDAPALAAAVLRLLSNPGEAARYGAAARARAFDEFATGPLVERTLAAYEECLSLPAR